MAKKNRKGSYCNGSYLKSLSTEERAQVLETLYHDRMGCLYKYLRKHAASDGWCRISIGTMSKEIGMARKNVCMALRGLKDAGRIEIQAGAGAKCAGYHVIS